jgi:hypothetical protein
MKLWGDSRIREYTVREAAGAAIKRTAAALFKRGL